jgi:hypothetical protein
MSGVVSGYSAVLQNLASGRIVAELPISAAKATRALNAPGSVGVTLPLELIKPVISASDVEERRNAIFLLRDDVVVGDGIIEAQDADVKANGLQLDCLGWHNYVRNLFLKQTIEWDTEDQTLIAKWLIDYASSKSGALRFGTSNVVASGRQRKRTYYDYERRPIGKIIDDLSAVIDGFHFRYQSARGDTGYTTEFVTSYPATGRETNIVLEMGGNVELLSRTGDGGSMANSVEAIGSGQGIEAPIEAAIDVDMLASTPLWEAVETYSDVIESATLREKAQRRLALGRNPIRIPKLRIGADSDPQLGSYLPGDRVRVRGEYGLLTVDDEFLIQQIDISVDPGSEHIDLSVVPVEAFR